MQGGIVSGGPVPADFVAGWGKHPFTGEKAHHWTADRTFDLPDGAYGLRSACLLLTVATRQVPLLGAGTYEYCQRCENRKIKEMNAQVRNRGIAA